MINNFTGDGIYLASTSGNTIGGATTAGRNVIAADGLHGIEFNGANSNLVENNYIGTDVTGNVALWVGHNGINDLGASNTFMGNVIDASGNIGLWIKEGSTLVEGNLIGLNAAGTAALGNAGAGIQVSSSGNTIGGTTAAARNVIAGNTASNAVGINVAAGANGNLIEGNYIGTNPDGNIAVPNSVGIQIVGALGNTIGGLRPRPVPARAMSSPGIPPLDWYSALAPPTPACSATSSAWIAPARLRWATAAALMEMALRLAVHRTPSAG